MAEKVDRRVRKTKAALRAGLIKLMLQKNIREITVRELVEEVDINRSTFYLHYNDIYDMLRKIEQELLDELMSVTQKYQNEYANEQLLIFLEEIFTVLLKNIDICNLLMSPNGDMNFITNIKQLITSHVASATIELFKDTQSVDVIEYACSFYISGVVGLIEQWLKRDTKETPKELSDLCYKLIKNGVVAYIPDV